MEHHHHHRHPAHKDRDISIIRYLFYAFSIYINIVNNVSISYIYTSFLIIAFAETMFRKNYKQYFYLIIVDRVNNFILLNTVSIYSFCDFFGVNKQLIYEYFLLPFYYYNVNYFTLAVILCFLGQVFFSIIQKSQTALKFFTDKRQVRFSIVFLISLVISFLATFLDNYYGLVDKTKVMSVLSLQIISLISVLLYYYFLHISNTKGERRKNILIVIFITINSSSIINTLYNFNEFNELIFTTVLYPLLLSFALFVCIAKYSQLRFIYFSKAIFSITTFLAVTIITYNYVIYDKFMISDFKLENIQVITVYFIITFYTYYLVNSIKKFWKNQGIAA